MDDTEKLRLYAQSVVTKNKALDASLSKAKSRFKHWEREAKASAKKILGAKKERDEAKKEAQVTRLAASTAGDAKARVEDDLSRVQEALVVVEEAMPKVEAETPSWRLSRLHSC